MNKIFTISNTTLPFVTAVSMALLLIESVTYPGFILKHLFVNPNIIVMLNVIQISIYTFTKINTVTENKLQNLVFNLTYLLLPVFIIIYIILLSLETKNYPNYIYSTIHLNLDSFFKALILVAIIVFFGVVNAFRNSSNYFKATSKGFNSKIVKSKKAILILFTLLIVYQLIFSFADTTQVLLKNNIYILNNLNDDYDKKMFNSWHFFYMYMKFVSENTPLNAKIAIPPPVRPWLSEGNSVLVRYFLYPRYLITVENENGDNTEPEYYLMTKGLWKAYNDEEYGWPRHEIIASEIIYFDPVNYTSQTEKNINFDPNNEKNKYGWGLIKVKKI